MWEIEHLMAYRLKRDLCANVEAVLARQNGLTFFGLVLDNPDFYPRIDCDRDSKTRASTRLAPKLY